MERYIIREVTENVTIANENAVIIAAKDIQLSLPLPRVGRQLDIFINSGASVTIDADDKPIIGGFVCPRGSHLIDRTIVTVGKAGKLSLLCTGTSWRLSGTIYE